MNKEATQLAIECLMFTIEEKRKLLAKLNKKTFYPKLSDAARGSLIKHYTDQKNTEQQRVIELANMVRENERNITEH